MTTPRARSAQTRRRRRPYSLLATRYSLLLLLLLLALSALHPFSPLALSSTAPVNLPPTATLDLTDPTRPTLFLTAYSHLDTQWRWT